MSEHHGMARLTRRLRWFIGLIAVVVIAAAVIGMLPGAKVYDDEQNCVRNGLAQLVITEHSSHPSACTPAYTVFSGTRPAGGLALIIYAVALLVPAAVLFRLPRRWLAWCWFAWNIVASVASLLLWFAIDFHLDLFSNVESLWPAPCVQALLVVLALLLLIVLPLLIEVSRGSAR